MWKEFEHFLEVLNINLRTRKNYVSTIRLLEKYAGKPADQCTRGDIISFLSRYSPNSRHRHLYALRKFYADFLGRPEVLQGIKIAREDRELDFWLSVDDVRRIISIAPLRERAIIRLGYDLALRVGEVVLLDREDIQGDIIVVKVLKKRGLVKVPKPLYPQTKKAILEYLETRGDDHPALFVSRKGRRISTDTVEYNFRKICEKAGVRLPPDVGFHVLRHSRAAHMREAGVDIDVISRFLSHSNINITFRYYAHIGRQKLYEFVPPPAV